MSTTTAGVLVSDLGEVVPLAVHVRNVDGNPMNAEVVTLTVIRPDLTTTSVDVLNPPAVTGRYTAEVVPTGQPGLYTYRWQTTGPNLVHEGAFHVEPPGAVSILPFSTAKTLLGMATDDRYDDDIAGTSRAATRLAERVRREKILRTPIVETRDLGRGWVRGVALTRRPVISLTAVDRLASDDTVVETLTAPAVTVDERGIVTAASPTALWGRVRFRYVAGYLVIPDEFREATGYILQSLWANRRGAGNRPRVGGQDTSEDTPDTRSVPSRALDLLGAGEPRPLVG